MEHGEPPGRIIDRINHAEDSARPLRINVDISFIESETSIAARHVLLKPLQDALYEASIVQEDSATGRPFNRTVAALHGVTAHRVNGHVHYRGTLSVSKNLADTVETRVRTAVEGLRDRFKKGFDSVRIEIANPPGRSPVEPSPTVELPHEDPDRYGQQGEAGRDGIGAEPARA